MKLLKRIKNLYKLSEIELPEDKREQISNIISPERPRMAQIIKMRDEEKIIKDLIDDQ